MKILQTPIKDLLVIEREPKRDERGYFERLFCEIELENELQRKGIVQINHTLTKLRGTVRGLHFQYPPHTETKIVSCLRGKVFDVAVDLRCGSPTFLKWHAEILDDQNFRSMYIPEGFAHGFQTLSSNCQMLYLHTSEYCATAEGGIHYKEPKLKILWPLPTKGFSKRDEQQPFLERDFRGIL